MDLANRVGRAEFPAGQLPGVPEFRNKYFNLSMGDGDMRGPWNQGEQWEFVDAPDAVTNADPGGGGGQSVQLTPDQQALGEKAKERLMSDLDRETRTDGQDERDDERFEPPHAGALQREQQEDVERVSSAPTLLSVVGDSATASLLVAAQVVLSVQLPFAMVPLIRLTASRALMSGYANLRSVTLLASVAAAAIIACNVWLVMWAIDNAHGFGTLIVVATLAVAALASLVHIAIVPLRTSAAIGYTSVDAPPPGGRSRQSQPL